MFQELSHKLLDDYEKGTLSRREVVSRLMGLGAALAVAEGAVAQNTEAEQQQSATFQAKGLDHIALDVTDVARSRDFYAKHLGLRAVRDSERSCFMAPPEGDFILALFQSEQPGMNHYCYAIDQYEAGDVVDKLIQARLSPRREGNRVYFPDPDDLTVQLAQRE